jgi:hypothetical protein
MSPLLNVSFFPVRSLGACPFSWIALPACIYLSGL